MENVSDRNGRAFEYLICEKTLKLISKATLSPRAVDDQKRDKQKYLSLPDSLVAEFEIASDKISKWIKDQVSTFPGEIIIDRLPDNAAKKGDVTDIKIFTVKNKINLSIKYNHFALKHQRPPTAVEQMGFDADSSESIKYREQYENTLNSFLSEAKKLKPSAEKFSELKNIDPSFINKNLYQPVCALVHDLYLKLGTEQTHADKLFRFLVGDKGFFKITLHQQTITVYDFNNIPPAAWLKSKITPDKPNYVYLVFSNGWQMSLRLHTASSRITKNVSLKFDTQPTKLPIKKWEL